MLEKGLQELQDKDPTFHQFMEGLGHRSKWTIAEDNCARWGHDTTNIAESVNGVLKKARNLPILALVTTSMHKTIEWFERRRKEYEGRLGQGRLWFDRIEVHMHEQSEVAREYIVRTIHSPLGLYEIELAPNMSHGQARTIYRVNLKERVCDCNRFQGLRVPCSHAIAACRPSRVDPYSLIHDYYSVEQSLRAYDGVFYPIGDKTMWPEVDVIWIPDPERARTKVGRPVSTRIHNNMDVRYDKEDRTPKTQKKLWFMSSTGS